MLVTVYREHVGVIAVMLRNGPNTKGRKELPLVQHEPEHTRQLLARNDGQELPLAVPALAEALEVFTELGAVPDEPRHAALEAGQTVHEVGLERLHREERDQPDQRPYPHRALLPRWDMQHVVEEAVFVVPELDAFAATVVHRVRDEHEVLEEL